MLLLGVPSHGDKRQLPRTHAVFPVSFIGLCFSLQAVWMKVIVHGVGTASQQLMAMQLSEEFKREMQFPDLA